MKNKKITAIKLKNIAILLSVPLVVYLVMEAISQAVSGTHVLSSKMEVFNLGKTTIQMALTAFALSLNMSSGRMDFSLGAQQMIGCIVGGNLALRLGMGPVGVLLMSVAFGALAGFIVGVLFVITRIPSMVLGMGMALVYECICFAVSVDGLQLYGRANMALLSDIGFQVLVMAIVLVIFIILYDHTGFGYHYKAIQGSQKIALNMGVNVNRNCIACYTLAGATIALAGVFSASYTGVLPSTMGMASSGLAFTALLPVFVAAFLGRYTNTSVALLIGALISRIISVALIQLAIPDPAVTAINNICLAVFLLVTNYSKIFDLKKQVKQRIQEAERDEALQVATN